MLLLMLLLLQLLLISHFSHRNLAQLSSIPDLPVSHLLRYYSYFPQELQHCQAQTECASKVAALLKTQQFCFGFESNCNASQYYQQPQCASGRADHLRIFHNQADFGYIKQQLRELQLLCHPHLLTDSSLECTQYLRFCRARNFLYDFSDLPQRKQLIRYHTDVLKPGQILAHCAHNQSALQLELEHMGALQSHAPELRFMATHNEPIMSSALCDIVETLPTFIMKIDATYNMYHHFCDFFNLYASLFVNQSHASAFDRDVRILIWETHPYDSPFAVTFQAFTKHAVWTLNEVSGKRVCFRNLVLPLLPRMIFGLYYNTPLIPKCSHSALFRAFSEFILHRLQIAFEAPALQQLRITFLLRRTKYRRVLNQQQLLQALNAAAANYQVRAVTFEALPFIEQLHIIRNTDVLIGMHGAGLTHLLFLPNWATVFELHNCEDPNCYKDLARLRGVNYMTWQNEQTAHAEDAGHHPEGGAHAKFTNYSFDVADFLAHVAEAAAKVQAHAEFRKYVDEANETPKDEL